MRMGRPVCGIREREEMEHAHEFFTIDFNILSREQQASKCQKNAIVDDMR
jgi:hypothetical protein